MKSEILFMHSAGNQGPGEGSYELVSYLNEKLGAAYHIRYPIMPDPDNPSYEQWKTKLHEEFTKLPDNTILIGHSLGGSVLLKYLSERKVTKAITSLFLIAVPFWSSKNWEVAEFVLKKDFQHHLPEIPVIRLYHSVDDQDVPCAHVHLYRKHLKNAVVYELPGNDHVFQKGLPALVEHIRSLV